MNFAGTTKYLPPGAFDWWDKAQHALGFAVLGGFGLLGYSLATARVVIGLLLYGAAIEVAQSATGWRYGDWQDWLADAVGVLTAYIVWARLMSLPQEWMREKSDC